MWISPSQSGERCARGGGPPVDRQDVLLLPGPSQPLPHHGVPTRRSVLTLLQCRAGLKGSSQVVWNLVKNLRFVYLLQAETSNFFTPYKFAQPGKSLLVQPCTCYLLTLEVKLWSHATLCLFIFLVPLYMNAAFGVVILTSGCRCWQWKPPRDWSSLRFQFPSRMNEWTKIRAGLFQRERERGGGGGDKLSRAWLILILVNQELNHFLSMKSSSTCRSAELGCRMSYRKINRGSNQQTWPVPACLQIGFFTLPETF